jgi:MFS family permease
MAIADPQIRERAVTEICNFRGATNAQTADKLLQDGPPGLLSFSVFGRSFRAFGSRAAFKQLDPGMWVIFGGPHVSDQAERMHRMDAEDCGKHAPSSRRLPLWRQRNFMLLWTGQTISMTGSAVTTVALPLVAIAVLGASAVEVGLLTAAAYGAFIFVSLPAGVVVDRLPKRKIMIWCDSSRLVIIGSVPVAAALHRLTLGQLYAVALMAGACAVFFDVSQQSYLSSLLDPSDLTEGFGKLGASASFAQVSGRGLASGLVAVIGAAKAITADALSYAVSVTCLLLIRGNEPRPEAKSIAASQLRRDIVQGLIFITHHPVLRKTTACAATGNFFIAMQISLNLLFLVRVLHVPPALAGLFTAMGSLGGVVGGMLAASIGRRIGSARIIWFSLLVFGAPSLILPLAEPGWRTALFVLGYGVAAFACAIFAASQLAYRQSVCPPGLRGRMNAASRWIIWGTLPFGGLLGGILGSTIGIRSSIWIAYAGSWAAGFLVFFSPLRYARDVSDLPTGGVLALSPAKQKADR